MDWDRGNIIITHWSNFVFYLARVPVGLETGMSSKALAGQSQHDSFHHDTLVDILLITGSKTHLGLKFGLKFWEANCYTNQFIYNFLLEIISNHFYVEYISMSGNIFLSWVLPFWR